MKKQYLMNFDLGILLLVIFVLYGFSNITLKDVETAIISQDYEQAKQLAIQLLSDESADSQQDEIQYYLGL